MTGALYIAMFVPDTPGNKTSSQMGNNRTFALSILEVAKLNNRTCTRTYFCLFDMILYIPVNNFSAM